MEVINLSSIKLLADFDSKSTRHDLENQHFFSESFDQIVLLPYFAYLYGTI